MEEELQKYNQNNNDKNKDEITENQIDQFIEKESIQNEEQQLNQNNEENQTMGQNINQQNNLDITELQQIQQQNRDQNEPGNQSNQQEKQEYQEKNDQIQEEVTEPMQQEEEEVKIDENQDQNQEIAQEKQQKKKGRRKKSVFGKKKKSTIKNTKKVQQQEIQLEQNQNQNLDQYQEEDENEENNQNEEGEEQDNEDEDSSSCSILDFDQLEKEGRIYDEERENAKKNKKGSKGKGRQKQQQKQLQQSKANFKRGKEQAQQQQQQQKQQTKVSKENKSQKVKNQGKKNEKQNLKEEILEKNRLVQVEEPVQQNVADTLLQQKQLIVEQENQLIYDDSVQGMLEYHTKAPDTLIEFIDNNIIKPDIISALRKKNHQHKILEFSTLKKSVKQIKNYYRFTDHLDNVIEYVFEKQMKSQSSSSLSKKDSSKSKNDNEAVEEEKNISTQNDQSEKITNCQNQIDNLEKSVDCIDKNDNNKNENNNENINQDLILTNQDNQQNQNFQSNLNINENQQNQDNQENQDNENDDIDGDNEFESLIENIDDLETEVDKQVDGENDKSELNQDQNEQKKQVSLINKNIKRFAFNKQDFKFLKVLQSFQYNDDIIQNLKQTNETNIDDLRDKCLNNMFPTFFDFDKKFKKLIAYTLQQRCTTVYSKAYILQLYENYEFHVKKTQIAKKFEQIKYQDLKKLFKADQQNRIISQEWPNNQQEKREYEEIYDYEAQPQSKQGEIKEKLKSLKKPQICDIDCVCKKQDYSQLSDFSWDEGNWKSTCKNRANRIECESCNNCLNQSNKLKKEKVIGKDVQEQLCWGIDLYTRKNIFYLLPELIQMEEKTHFIEQSLLKAANLLNENGWNIISVLDYIIEHSMPKSEQRELQRQYQQNNKKQGNKKCKKQKNQKNTQSSSEEKSELEQKQASQQSSSQNSPNIINNNNDQNNSINNNNNNSNENFQGLNYLKSIYSDKNYLFTPKDRTFAKLIKKIAIINQQAKLDTEAFRLHTKGFGVVCLKPEGIKKNELITKYIGQIYQPWRWLERQDSMKKFQLTKEKKDFLPDFYNVILESHKDDPKGYDMLFVDPIIKGNYSSRFNHSCDPNCLNVTTVSEGNYFIGMYAMKNISYGQELSWDYNSITESRQEHNKAICLCGQMKCRGKYLALIHSIQKEHNQYFDTHQNFLQRMIDIYDSCQKSLQNFKQLEKQNEGEMETENQNQNDDELNLILKNFSKEDKQILESCSFRLNLLRNSPQWLIYWIIHKLQFINEENKIYYNQLINDSKQNKQGVDPVNYKIYCVNQAWSKKESRIQSLVQAIDRVKYLIPYENQQIQQIGPVKKLKQEQQFSYIFGDQYLNGQNGNFYYISQYHQGKSIIGSLLEVLEEFQIVKQCRVMKNYINEINLFFLDQKRESYEKNQYVRLFLLRISHYLRSAKECYFNYFGLQMILYFYAFTFTYFQFNNSNNIDPQNQLVLQYNELFKKNLKENQNQIFEDKKTYHKNFILCQMLQWHKQNKDYKVQLNSEEKGTISYPNLTSFSDRLFNYPLDKSGSQNEKKKQQKSLLQQQCSQNSDITTSNNNNNNNNNYKKQFIAQQQGGNFRKAFIDKLKYSPSSEWHIESTRWQFKNPHKIYGTMFLDGQKYKQQFQGKNFSSTVLDLIDESFQKKYQYWKEVEMKINENVSEQDLEQKLQVLIDLETDKLNLKIDDEIPMETENLQTLGSEEQIQKALEIYRMKYQQKINQIEQVQEQTQILNNRDGEEITQKSEIKKEKQNDENVKIQKIQSQQDGQTNKRKYNIKEKGDQEKIEKKRKKEFKVQQEKQNLNQALDIDESELKSGFKIKKKQKIITENSENQNVNQTMNNVNTNNQFQKQQNDQQNIKINNNFNSNYNNQNNYQPSNNQIQSNQQITTFDSKEYNQVNYNQFQQFDNLENSQSYKFIQNQQRQSQSTAQHNNKQYQQNIPYQMTQRNNQSNDYSISQNTVPIQQNQMKQQYQQQYSHQKYQQFYPNVTTNNLPIKKQQQQNYSYPNNNNIQNQNQNYQYTNQYYNIENQSEVKFSSGQKQILSNNSSEKKYQGQQAYNMKQQQYQNQYQNFNQLQQQNQNQNLHQQYPENRQNQYYQHDQINQTTNPKNLQFNQINQQKLIQENTQQYQQYGQSENMNSRQYIPQSQLNQQQQIQQKPVSQNNISNQFNQIQHTNINNFNNKTNINSDYNNNQMQKQTQNYNLGGNNNANYDNDNNIQDVNLDELLDGIDGIDGIDDIDDL